MALRLRTSAIERYTFDWYPTISNSGRIITIVKTIYLIILWIVVIGLSVFLYGGRNGLPGCVENSLFCFCKDCYSVEITLCSSF